MPIENKRRAMVLGAPSDLSDDKNIEWYTVREMLWPVETQKVYDRCGMEADALAIKRTIYSNVGEAIKCVAESIEASANKL